MPKTINTSLQRRLARQRRQEGMTLLEIMIVVMILAFIGTGVAVALLPALERAQIDGTKTDAQSLRSAATLYKADNPRECPTVEALVNERYLDATRRTADAWDTPFQITCEEGELFVRSAGPDGEFDTEDDI